MGLYERLDTIGLEHHGHKWQMTRPGAREGARLAVLLDEMRMCYAQEPQVSEVPTDDEVASYRSWANRMVAFSDEHLGEFLRAIADHLIQIDGASVHPTEEDVDESLTHVETLRIWGEWQTESRLTEQEKKESAPPSTPPTTPSDGTIVEPA